MTRMTPSEAFVETLVAHGVKHVFGIVGSAYMDALDLFEPAGIRFISVAHEQGAGHMADGYSRVLNKQGVCIAQNGPGITNFVTAVAAAYWAHSPVVVITPETGSNSIGLGGFQETEQLPIFSKITKYQAHVSRADRMAELTSRCFDLALTERGPTQLNIPRDVFYGDIDVNIPTPIKIERAAGGGKSLDDAAKLLASAKFPVILAGGGVIMSDGQAEAVALAEYLQAPVVTSYLHNDAFPAGHPLMCGPLGYQGSKAAMKLIAQADVVLALGSRLGPFGTLPQHGIDYWPKNAKLIQVDSNHRMLGLVKPMTVGVCGDAKPAAAEMLHRLQHGNMKIEAHGNKDQRLAEVKKQKAEWEDELNKWGQADGTPIAPRRALRELEKALPKNAMVTTDIGNICSVSNSYLRFEQAALLLRRHELRQLRLCLSHGHRRQGGGAGPAGHRLCRRRRLGHEPAGDADLRAREHPGHRRGVQQRPVGRGEEEPDRLLRRPLCRHQPEEPLLRRHRQVHGRRRASRWTSPAVSATR